MLRQSDGHLSWDVAMQNGSIDRRAFLIRTGRVAALIAVGCKLPTTARAAVDPSTVITIVNIASTLAEMFRKNGPTIDEFMYVQTQMIANISNQLGNIKNSIEEVLRRADELKQLVGEVPDQTVITLYKATILGEQDRYLEILKTYQDDLMRPGGIARARLGAQEELEHELLAPLKLARDGLMTYKNRPAIVPLVCTAAFVETHAMIMTNLAESHGTRMLQALSRYCDWFQEIMSGAHAESIDNQIKQAQVEAAGTLKSAHFDLTFDCFSDQTPFYSTRYCSAGHAESYSCHRIKGKSFVKPFRGDNRVAHAVLEMIKSGKLSKEERPQSVFAEYVEMSPVRSQVGCIGEPPASDRVLGPRACEVVARETSCDSKRTELNTRVEEWTHLLNDTGFRLLALRAYRSAASDALEFLQNMKAEVAKIVR